MREVAVTDDALGCPHEEGIDFPEGQECPYCPYWRGKQGIQVVDDIQDADPYREMKALTRQHMRLVWEGAQLGIPLAGEKARLVSVMRELPEYSDLWGRLDELPDEEIERDDVNPILHVTIHSIKEDHPISRINRPIRQLIQSGDRPHPDLLADILACGEV